jgi:hypothetical protein
VNFAVASQSYLDLTMNSSDSDDLTEEFLTDDHQNFLSQG